MNYFTRIARSISKAWNNLWTRLFGAPSKPVQEVSKPVPEPPQERAPEKKKVKMRAVPKPKSGRAHRVLQWEGLFKNNAELWEMNPPQYVEFLDSYGRDTAVEAIMNLNWSRIVFNYQNSVLENIYFHSTDLGIDGHPETKKRIENAVIKERDRRHRLRNTGTPANHGMNGEGNQQ